MPNKCGHVQEMWSCAKKNCGHVPTKKFCGHVPEKCAAMCEKMAMCKKKLGGHVQKFSCGNVQEN